MPEPSQKDQASNPSGSSSPQDPSQSTEGSGNPTTDPQAGQGSGQPDEVVIQPGEGARTFTHPLLKDKSPEEIERIFQAQQDAIRAQNRELNDYHSRLAAAEQQSAPAPRQPTQSDEGDDYGDNFLAPALKKLENRIERRLEEMINPLRSHLSVGAATTARERLRGELRYFSTLEPQIDQILRQQGQNPSVATEQQLRLLYHTAVGLATERGVNLEGSAPAPRREEPAQQQNNQPTQQPVNIPQRRPSAAPLPQTQGNQPPKRQLTEEERRLAREFGLTEEKYIELQEADVDDVVQPGFSRDNW